MNKKIIYTLVNFATLPKWFELVCNWFCNWLCLIFFKKGCTENKRFAIITNVSFNGLSKTHHLCVVPVFWTWKWAIVCKKLLTSIQLFGSTVFWGICICILGFNLDDWFQRQWNNDKINFSQGLPIEIFNLQPTQNYSILGIFCSFPQAFKDFIFKFTAYLKWKINYYKMVDQCFTNFNS